MSSLEAEYLKQVNIAKKAYEDAVKKYEDATTWESIDMRGAKAIATYVPEIDNPAFFLISNMSLIKEDMLSLVNWASLKLF